MNGAQNHKRVKAITVAAAIISSAIANPALGQANPGQSSVSIVRPLSFFITDQLDFGKVLAGTAGGTVVLAPNGTRTKTGDVTLIGNGQQPAVFAGQGTNRRNVDISVSANAIDVTGPGAPMQVQTWVIGSTPTAILTTTPRRFRINSTTGVFSFPVGATLTVGPNQTPGKYSGTYSIILEYQ